MREMPRVGCCAAAGDAATAVPFAVGIALADLIRDRCQ